MITTPSNGQTLTPNAIAEAITGRSYLSWSQLTLMRSCPRKFHFQYVENAHADFVSSSLIFGGAIHQALELFYQQRLEGMAVSHDDLVGVYRNAWAERDDDETPVRFNKTESQELLDESASAMLAAFMESVLVDMEGDIIGVEESLRGPLAADIPDLVARVDLAWQARDGLHVLDFKTSRSKWKQETANEKAEQLYLYRHLANALSDHDRQPIHLHYGVITKAKSPVVQLLNVTADPQGAAKLAESIRPVWRAMKEGIDFTNPNPLSCSTCPFKSRCPAFAK